MRIPMKLIFTSCVRTGHMPDLLKLDSHAFKIERARTQWGGGRLKYLHSLRR